MVGAAFALALPVFAALAQSPVVAPRLAPGVLLVGSRLSASAVRTLLEARGYRNVGKVTSAVTRFGNTVIAGPYKVWARDRFGRRVKLHVSRSSGEILKKIVYDRLSVAALETLLGRHGYRDIAKVRLQRGSYVLRARDLFGRPVELVVNPITAKVLHKTIFQ